jgi:hypothetical protein
MGLGVDRVCVDTVTVFGPSASRCCVTCPTGRYTRTTLDRSHEAVARSRALLERMRLDEEAESMKACPAPSGVIRT